ncbi:hypothetical protein DFAR_3390008 [Desulfarculales bacterium]
MLSTDNLAHKNESIFTDALALKFGQEHHIINRRLVCAIAKGPRHAYQLVTVKGMDCCKARREGALELFRLFSQTAQGNALKHRSGLIPVNTGCVRRKTIISIPSHPL